MTTNKGTPKFLEQSAQKITVGKDKKFLVTDKPESTPESKIAAFLAVTCLLPLPSFPPCAHRSVKCVHIFQGTC